MENAVYAITALRWQGPDQIGEAMMGLLDVDRMQWDLAPAPTRYTTVIDRVLDGDTVVTWARGTDMADLGPGLQVAVTADGLETLAFADERAGTRLEDLPRF
jgi:hypothetical protein